MSDKRSLPETASVAHHAAGARLHAPSAERNAADIARVLTQYAPAKGRALEIASGTGQHMVQFAQALPNLQWHPSDLDPARLASIDDWTVGIKAVAKAAALDASKPGWAKQSQPWDLIIVINLLHLIRTDEAQVILSEVATALAPKGKFILYGPFMRAGELTSEGDARFDASLREADPLIGYKDDFDVIDWLHSAGLALVQVIEMPANNLCMIAEKSA
ncbi:MAG: DUF938 domain-containing protein [Roseovarius sp.]